MVEVAEQSSWAASAGSLRLDDLLARSCAELQGMYAQASTPALSEVAGDLRGRMLATTVLPDGIAHLVRAWASSEAFVWRGKTFLPSGEREGGGINRVVSDRLRLFRFKTSIGPSRAGPFDALQLDYDLPSNPFFIRAIKDEMRELHPGLWLGQAYLHTARRETLVLYFGLEQ
jgi:hypothetical protein